MRGDWRVIDRGVNGGPFLWKRRGTSLYVMINIFNPQAKKCYLVLALRSSPYQQNDLNGRIIGKGCSKEPNDWVLAYQKAREIAERYMDKN
ncbi:MAG TPA: hypothetical protein VLV31_04505 [Candidatus Acidoferrales bacterium]|nr:hypothetical protein [Candidatus Acidoferrales bacterium]